MLSESDKKWIEDYNSQVLRAERAEAKLAVVEKQLEQIKVGVLEAAASLVPCEKGTPSPARRGCGCSGCKVALKILSISPEKE